jgi:tetratricopeptide (TPR) repeat protein
LPEPAIEAFERAMRLSPLDPLQYMCTAGIAFAHLLAGRYEEAIDWAHRSLRDQPRYITSNYVRVVACVCLGQTKVASEYLQALVHLQPDLTMTKYKENYSAAFSPEILTMLLEGLRKAGLPEE